MRTRLPPLRIRFAVTLALLLITLASLLSQSALAQRPAAPKDTTPKDSRPRGVGCEMCLGVVLAGFVVAVLVAPPALLFIKHDTSDHRRPGAPFADPHVSLYFVGGGSWEKPGLGWVRSEILEVHRKRMYGEVDFENSYFSDLGHFQFQSVRAGYLLHNTAMAGGVSLGYRRAVGDRVQDALQIGLPLAMDLGRQGGVQASWRFEPTYLISSQGVSWNYRLQWDLAFPRSHLVTGFNVETKPARQGDPYYATINLLVGTWF